MLSPPPKTNEKPPNLFAYVSVQVEGKTNPRAETQPNAKPSFGRICKCNLTESRMLMRVTLAEVCCYWLHGPCYLCSFSDTFFVVNFYIHVLGTYLSCKAMTYVLISSVGGFLLSAYLVSLRMFYISLLLNQT